MPDNIQAKRLYDSIKAAAGREKAEEILVKLPLAKAPSDKKKAEWACKSCAALSECFAPEVVTAIRKGCHCKPPAAEAARLAKMWNAGSGAEDFARKLAVESSTFDIRADGENLLLTYPVCYCSFLKRTKEAVPAEWCACSLGYAEDMFSQVTGHAVTATLDESVLTGGEKCVIRIHI